MALRDWLPRKFAQQANSNQLDSETLLPDNGDEDANRIAAGLAVEALRPTITIALENIGSISRWLLASLLTVNAGAIVALISNADKIATTFFFYALVCFMLGLCAAFSVGLKSLSNSDLSFSMLGEFLGYWSGVQSSGQRNAEIEQKLHNKREANQREARKLADIGKAGLALFLIGVALAAFGAQQ